MGDFQSGLVETKFPDQQKIEIESSRLAARATSSTETCFDGEQPREQLARRSVCFACQDRIEIIGVP
jgi:hypothetical protein